MIFRKCNCAYQSSIINELKQNHVFHQPFELRIFTLHLLSEIATLQKLDKH